jgi:hypothetical protein
MKHRNQERAEEMELAIALWRESGLSKYAFCRNEKIGRATFNYWLKKYDNTLNPPLSKKTGKTIGKSKQSFVAVNISSPEPSYSELELEYPNGVKLRLPFDLSQDKLRSLIGIY